MGTAIMAQRNALTDDYHTLIDGIFALNPGVNFVRPIGWVGNRPVFTNESATSPAALSGKRWMADPKGIMGSEADIARNYIVTASPTGPTDTRIPEPYSWDIANPYDAAPSTAGYSNVQFGWEGATLTAFQDPNGVWVASFGSRTPVEPPWWAFYTSNPGIDGRTGLPVNRDDLAKRSPGYGANINTTPVGPGDYVAPVVGPGPAQILPVDNPSPPPTPTPTFTPQPVTLTPVAKPQVTLTAPGAHIDMNADGVQTLPVNATVATRVTNWPMIIGGIIALVLVVLFIRHKRKK